MNIFPAIDLFGGKAVRLYKGDYAQMTVYSDRPVEVARAFESAGAKFLHLVDLEGAKSGLTLNLETIKEIIKETDLFTEVGGGIRSMETIDKYLSIGVSRVILGTAAITDERKPPSSRALTPRMVVPPGEHTAFLRSAGWP